MGCPQASGKAHWAMRTTLPVPGKIEKVPEWEQAVPWSFLYPECLAVTAGKLLGGSLHVLSWSRGSTGALRPRG